MGCCEFWALDQLKQEGEVCVCVGGGASFFALLQKKEESSTGPHQVSCWRRGNAAGRLTSADIGKLSTQVVKLSLTSPLGCQAWRSCPSIPAPNTLPFPQGMLSWGEGWGVVRRQEREQRGEEANGEGEVAERKRMREEIAVWAEICLLHFLWRKWLRSGSAAACWSSH